MALEDFRRLLPGASPAGQNVVDGKAVDAYELRHARVYRTDVLWFYFYDKKLIKWGPPDAWPEAADLIIDIR